MKLGELCLLFTDGDWIESKDQSDSGIRLIQTGNIGNGEFLYKNDKAKYISEDTFKRLNCTEVFPDDILISRLPEPVGRGCIIPDIGERMITAVDCTICRVNEKLIDRKYFCYFLESNTYKTQLEQHVTGTTRKRISRKNLSSVEIDIPEQAKQKEIVYKLDRLKKIIQNYNRESDLLDELVRARFVEMFGDLESNSMNWEKSLLANKLNVIGGYAFRSSEFNECEGIPVLRIGNINSGYFKPVNMVYWKENPRLSKYEVYPGDLVMSLTGTVGKDDYGNVCILGNEYGMYYLNQRNAKLEIVNGLNKYYLTQLLKFSYIKDKLTGINRGVRQANISNKDILDLVVPVPPLELQNQFASFVEEIDKSRLLSNHSLFLIKSIIF